jgi:hypothetical protein
MSGRPDKALPALEVRTGKRAWEAAADKDQWVQVKAAVPQGQPEFVYFVPPEIAYLFHDHSPWEEIERHLTLAIRQREAAAARAAATRPASRRKSAAPSTRAFVRALAAYLDADERV